LHFLAGYVLYPARLFQRISYGVGFGVMAGGVASGAEEQANTGEKTDRRAANHRP
jgi:hypothetical protein